MTLVWTGQTILAPLTKGGNLPFRRLCVELGAAITTSEMAYSRQVVRRSKSELALLRRHPSEPCFGVQLAAGKPEDAVAAGHMAVERGAAFVDLNCGCPIHDVVRRGMGATLLQRPAALARIVEAMARALPVPVTVKIRSGWTSDDTNALEIGHAVEQAGAAAITLHARSREQRYTKAADWNLVAALVAHVRIPVIGNGDVLTWYEAERRRRESGCAALMLGRGALIKPWLFGEIQRAEAYEPTAEQRVGIYFRFLQMLKEHFRDDAKGRERTMKFLPWHLGFLARYRPLPRATFEALALEHPLLQTRMPDNEDLPPLEGLLRDPREEVHQRLAEALWDSVEATDAVGRFMAIASESPPLPGDAGEIATAHG